MRASLAKWGKSRAVRLPREATAAAVGLREGAALDMTVEDGAVVLCRRRYDLTEMVAAMAGREPLPLEMEDEAQGSEVW